MGPKAMLCHYAQECVLVVDDDLVAAQVEGAANRQ